MKTASLLGLVFVVLLTGCSSYSFRGTKAAAFDLAVPMPSCKFRVDKFNLVASGSNAGNIWAISASASAKVDKRIMQSTLARMRPELFTEDETGIPLDIKVDVSECHGDYWGMVPYFLFLGIVPSRIVYFRESGTVSVCVSDNTELHPSQENIGFSSKGWLSVWTPFGAMMSDSPDLYQGESRSGAGVMVAPHLNDKCRADQQDVYSVTVANAVIAALGKMDKNALQRIAVLQSVKGEK